MLKSQNHIWAGCILLFTTANTAHGWSTAHARITQAAFDVQPVALKGLWSSAYQHPQDGIQRTIQAYLSDYFWWSGNPDHVDGPLNGSFASEARKNYAKLFHYGERSGAFAVPTPTGLPLPPEGAAWTYHYFTFPVAENDARAERGAEWYFDRIIEAFLDNRPEDAAQYAGSFAHAIQDRTSTYHAWDGYGAERIALEAANGLDSHIVNGISVFWSIDDSGVDPDITGYDPIMLGTNAAEAALEAANRFQLINDASRSNLSDAARYLGSHLNDDWTNQASSAATDGWMSEMAQGSSRLIADVFYTSFTLAFPTLTGPVAVNVQPDHDTYTRPTEPDTVQPHTGNLALGADTIWLKFDISGIPAGALVTEATLTVRTRNDNTIDPNVNLFEVSDDTWDETTITPNNAPSIGSLITTYVAEGTVTSGNPAGTSQLDTNDVMAWVQGNSGVGDPLISFALHAPGGSLFIRADEHADQSEHPWALLSVTAGPAQVAFTNVAIASMMGFEFQSVAGVDYRLQSSTNLVDWTDKNVIVHGLGGTELVFDPDGFDTNLNYRIVITVD